MKKDRDFQLDTREDKIAFIESILFVSKEPVSMQRFLDFFMIGDITELESILEEMKNRYENSARGITLHRAGGGIQLVTRPELHEHLKAFFTIRTASRLTVPSLETLSIVAYRQPVTSAEIADLRGVNSVGPIKSLLQKKLIKISGRKKVPGLPLLYATTREFLLYFGLNDLSELPSLEELTEMFEEKEQPSLFTDPI